MRTRTQPRTRGEIERELAQLQLMLDASVDCIKLIDLDGNLLKMNRSGCEALGLNYGETDFGMDWVKLLPADIHRKARRALKNAREGKRASFGGRSELPGQEPIFWDNILTPILDEDGRPKAILCLSRDISRQMRAEKKLKEASELDALTGLPNRRLLMSHLERAEKRAKRSRAPIGLLTLDFDNFKIINDEHGHDAGDFLLQESANRLRQTLRSAEFVARLGGDEFAVVIENVKTEANLAAIIARAADALRDPIQYKTISLNVEVSIGGALSSPTIDSIPALMKASDVALYAAKNAGRNTFQIFQNA